MVSCILTRAGRLNNVPTFSSPAQREVPRTPAALRPSAPHGDELAALERLLALIAGRPAESIAELNKELRQLTGAAWAGFAQIGDDGMFRFVAVDPPGEGIGAELELPVLMRNSGSETSAEGDRFIAAASDDGIPVGAFVVESPNRDSASQTVRRFALLAGLALKFQRVAHAERFQAEFEAELAAARERDEMRNKAIADILEAQERERHRISAELHDSLGQTLTSILLGLKVANDATTDPEISDLLATLRTQVADTTKQIQRISRDLRPSTLDDMGLSDSIERLVAESNRVTDAVITCTIKLGPARLDPVIETVVYRVAQEALNNALKHAGADRIEISLEATDDVVLEVADNGQGFSTEPKGRKGLGLTGMRERAALVGGGLEISSPPGTGSTVRLVVPIRLEQ